MASKKHRIKIKEQHKLATYKLIEEQLKKELCLFIPKDIVINHYSL